MADQDKIKLFQSLRKYFHILGTFSPESDEKRPFNPRNVFVLFCYIQMFASVLAFTLFKAKTVVEFGLNYYGYMTELVCISAITAQIYRKIETLKLIANCEEFIGKRRHAKITYNDVNEKIERVSKIIHFLTAKLSWAGVVLPSLPITAINYYIYDLEDESYYLPFPVVLPFNWKTPMGYLVALSAQAIAAYCTLLEGATVLSFLVGSCWLFISFIEDISQDLSVLNDEKSAERNHENLLKHYCNIIQAYSDVKQFVGDFNVLYEFIVLAFFVWTLSTIGSSVWVLQSESSTDLISNPLEIIYILTAITEMFWSFAMCAFFCECGERVSRQFNLFDDEICRCDWYSLPNNMQKMHQIFMQNTQLPVIIRGYPDIWCTREIFKMTVNKGFSFYMLAREMTT